MSFEGYKPVVTFPRGVVLHEINYGMKGRLWFAVQGFRNDLPNCVSPS